MNVEFDHIAILVADLMTSIKSLPSNNWLTGEIESFPTEGTKELYIGPMNAFGRLLLIEPIGAGPYRDALSKRGPGLHHLAVNVRDIGAFTEQISGSGWYLHPQSLATLEQTNTIWLARPGVPLLVEVVEREPMDVQGAAEMVSCVEVPVPDSKPELLNALGVEQFQRSRNAHVYVTIDGERHQLDELILLGAK